MHHFAACFRHREPCRFRPRVPVAVAAGVLAGGGLLGMAGLTVQPTVAAPLPGCAAPVTSAGTTTVTCAYTGGAQYWTVPAFVTQATFTLYGAAGGASSSGESGGLGAEVTATLPVSPGTVLQVDAGQGGGTNDAASTFNGGGPGAGGAGDGGGGTDLRAPAADGSYPVTSDLLAAGGGGGAGQDVTASGGPGGNADSPGDSGATVAGVLGGGGGGGAGTDTGPGAGGGGGSSPAGVASSGAPGGSGASQGTGGAGAPTGGGGGGGYFGGGGGGQGATVVVFAGGGGGGGGGASYTGDATGATLADGVTSPDGPNGEVKISYTACTITITGRHFGPLTVRSGLTCVTGASILGPVIVRAGASVAISQSTVYGSLSADRAGTVIACATRIGGPVSVTASTGPVLLGDPSCGPDTIDGTVVLAANTAGVELSGDTINGFVLLTRNSGGTQVSGNRIIALLACLGNDPAPVDNGQPNIVRGLATGQCARLA